MAPRRARQMRRLPLAASAVLFLGALCLSAWQAVAYDPRCQCTDDEFTDEDDLLCGAEGATEAQHDDFCGQFGEPGDATNCVESPEAAAQACSWKQCRRHSDCAVGTFCSSFRACTVCEDAPSLTECELYAIDRDCCSAELLKQCPQKFNDNYLAACDMPCEMPSLDSRASPTSCRSTTPAGALAMPMCQYEPLDCRETTKVHCCSYDDAEDCAVCAPVHPPWCDEEHGEFGLLPFFAAGSIDPTGAIVVMPDAALGQLPDSALQFSTHTRVEWRFASTLISMLITNERRCTAHANYTLELPLDARIDSVEVMPSDNSQMNASFPIRSRSVLNETSMDGAWDSVHYHIRAPVPHSGTTLIEIRYHQALVYANGAVTLPLPLAPNPETQRTDSVIEVDDSGVMMSFAAADASQPPYQTGVTIEPDIRTVRLTVAPQGSIAAAAPEFLEFVDTCATLGRLGSDSEFVSCEGSCVLRGRCSSIARQLKLAYTPAWHPEEGSIAHDEHGRMVYLFSPPSVQDETCNDPPMPRNLVMVMDKSAWMRGKRLNDTKEVFLSLLSVNGSMNFQPKDVLSIHT